MHNYLLRPKSECDPNGRIQLIKYSALCVSVHVHRKIDGKYETFHMGRGYWLHNIF